MATRHIVLILIYIVASSLALKCPANTRPLPPNSCIQVQDSSSTFGDAQSGCLSSNFDGLVVVTNAEFFTLVSYAQVIGSVGKMYWLGYMYVDSSNLQDVSGETVSSSKVLNEDVYDGNSAQEAMASGVCVAIGGGTGLLYRVQCSTTLPSFCQHRIVAPSANITVDPDRFVTVGSRVNLSPVSSGSNVTVTWRATLPGYSQPELLNVTEIEIPSFSISDHPGAYYCIASNELGSFVSEPVVLVAAHNSTTDMNSPSVTIMQDTDFPQFNSLISITCNYNSVQPVTTVQWFINGRPISAPSDTNSSRSILVQTLEEEGYYQCFVLTENGDNGGSTVLVSAQAGQPGPVNDLMVLADSRTQLFVSWLCPETANIHDSALLRYQILYHEGSEFNSSLALSVPDVRPVLLSGAESELCIVESLIPGVETGVQYVVKVVAMAPNNPGVEATIFALASTFGSVPNGVVDDLKVRRSTDDKTVVARWDKVVTTPPEGVVSRYQIQYRDANKGDITTIIHSREFNYLVVENVINANSYEVRVSLGVVVQRNPLEYDYGEFSAWVKVDGITTEIPSVPPPAGLGPATVGAIASGVVVGILVAVVLVVILVVGCVCLVAKNNPDKNFKKLPLRRKESQAVELQKK